MMHNNPHILPSSTHKRLAFCRQAVSLVVFLALLLNLPGLSHAYSSSSTIKNLHHFRCADDDFDAGYPILLFDYHKFFEFDTRYSWRAVHRETFDSEGRSLGFKEVFKGSNSVLCNQTAVLKGELLNGKTVYHQITVTSDISFRYSKNGEVYTQQLRHASPGSYESPRPGSSGYPSPPIDSRTIHVNGRTIRRFLISFLEEGDYVIRCGVVPLDGPWDDKPQEVWNSITDYTTSETIRIRFAHAYSWDSKPEIQMTPESFANWSKWLPEAPIMPDDHPGELKLYFKVKNDGNSNEKMKLRFRLGDISCFRGRWTNDYYAPDNKSNTDSSAHYSQAFDERFADMKVKGDGWDINFKTITYDDAPGQHLHHAFYEGVYADSVRAGDIVILKFLSFDFAARANLSFELRPAGIPDSVKVLFHPIPITNIANMKKGIITILPIPRDMEVTCVDNEKGDSTAVGLGDYLGDEWEEQFVGRELHVDRGIYAHSIEEILPYCDDSSTIKSFYQGTETPPQPDTARAKNLGDGFLNLEKYRGFYGILEDEEHVHRRLEPGFRNVLTSFLQCNCTETVKDPLTEKLVAKQTIIASDESSPFLSHWKTLDKRIKRHLFDINPSDYNIHCHRFSHMDEINLRFRNGDYNHIPYGFYHLNGRETRLGPRQKQILATYVSLITKRPKELKPFANTMVVNSYEDEAFGFAFRNIERAPWCPNFFESCHVYPEAINTFCRKYCCEEFSEEYWEIKRREAIANATSCTIAHEWGHFVGMKHPAADLPYRIMNARENDPFAEKKFYPKDYMHFRLYNVHQDCR